VWSEFEVLVALLLKEAQKSSARTRSLLPTEELAVQKPSKPVVVIQCMNNTEARLCDAWRRGDVEEFMAVTNLSLIRRLTLIIAF